MPMREDEQGLTNVAWPARYCSEAIKYKDSRDAKCLRRESEDEVETSSMS